MGHLLPYSRYPLKDRIGEINNELFSFLNYGDEYSDLTDMFLYFYYIETRQSMIIAFLEKIGFDHVSVSLNEKNPYNGRSNAFIIKAIKAEKMQKEQSSE